MKLNLGSHDKIVRGGWTNVDALDLENVDIIHDLTSYPYPFEDNSIEEIVMIEVLEHISWRETTNVLKECYRILKQGGKMHIQVPAIDEMCKMFVNDEISDVVPHKPESVEQVLRITEKTGKKVNPMRWMMAFSGAAKHQYDHHLAIFTKGILEERLEEAGFDKIDFAEDKLQWKIKVNCYK